MVGTAAGLQPNHARGQLGQHRPHLTQRDPAAQNRVAPLIDAVQLKDLLRHINPDACDVQHMDSLLLMVVGSHRRPGETHGTEVGESIPLEKALSLFRQAAVPRPLRYQQRPRQPYQPLLVRVKELIHHPSFPSILDGLPARIIFSQREGGRAHDE